MAWDDKIYFHLCFTHVFVSTQVKKNHRWGEKRVYNCLFAIVFMGTMKQLATNITNVNQWTDMSPMVTNGLTCHQCLLMDWHVTNVYQWTDMTLGLVSETLKQNAGLRNRFWIDYWTVGSRHLLWCFGCLFVPKRSKMGQDIAELWHFPLERFCDSIANNMGQKEIISCPFVPKRFKIGQEMAEFLPFSPWEFVWFHWESHGTKGDPFVFISTKRI